MLTVMRWTCSRAAATLHGLHDGAAELGVALGGEADAEGPRGDRAEAVAVDTGAGAFEQAAVNERAEEAKDGRFRKLGALDDLGKGELFAERAEGFEDLAGAQDGLGFVAVTAAV